MQDGYAPCAYSKCPHKSISKKTAVIIGNDIYCGINHYVLHQREMERKEPKLSRKTLPTGKSRKVKDEEELWLQIEENGRI